MKAVIFNAENKICMKDFLELPQRIYCRKNLMQNLADERAILEGNHVLSHYFTATPILIYDETRAVSRAVVTVYHGDNKAYLGFFESENDSAAAKLLFDTAVKIITDKSLHSVIGPVDCSFWIKYRLKTNHFGLPYTGEPYNRDYYLKLWEENGFTLLQKYFSNHYTVVENDEYCEKYSHRLAEKTKAGYEIKSPCKKNFDQTLHEIFSLLIELYKDFPAYKRISEEEFCKLFGYFGAIVDYDMVKMAYYDNKPVGFFVSIPDFGNTVYGKPYPHRLLKILSIKKSPLSYVMLYMGVDPNHRGLGKALTEAIRRELKEKHVPSVGALIRSENCNRDYVAQLIDFEFEYVLLKRTL